jgi:hypothetical protein
MYDSDDNIHPDANLDFDNHFYEPQFDFLDSRDNKDDAQKANDEVKKEDKKEEINEKKTTITKNTDGDTCKSVGKSNENK